MIAIQILHHLLGKHASVSISHFCSNDYYRTCVIIDYLTNELVFLEYDHMRHLKDYLPAKDKVY